MPSITIRRPEYKEKVHIDAILEAANFRYGCGEMDEFPLGNCFVAEVKNSLVGVCGYKILEEGLIAKHTMIAIKPHYRGLGIGSQLQEGRIAYLKSQGIKIIVSNVENVENVLQLNEKLGFKRTGVLIPKKEDFGRIDKKEWVNMILILD